MTRAEFERLASAWAARATALARAIAGDADAEDVAQEALIRAWRSLGSLADEARFDAWLMAIVRNLARNRVRDRAAEPRLVAPALSERAEGDRVERVRAAVEALPEEQREAVRLRFEADMSYEEIAAALGIAADLVRSRLHEAKETLRQRLQ